MALLSYNPETQPLIDYLKARYPHSDIKVEYDSKGTTITIIPHAVLEFINVTIKVSPEKPITL